MIKRVLALGMFVLATACGPQAPAAVSPELRLHSPRSEAGALFGRSVAIQGDLLAVGQPGPVSVADGKVYLYRIGPAGVQLVRTLQASSSGLYLGSDFGTSVALDGHWLLVGAPSQSRFGVRPGETEKRGAVAVYAFDGAFENVRLLTIIGEGFPTNVKLDTEWFGFDVDLSGDLLAIASVNASAARGRVHLYRVNDANFHSLTELREIGPELGLRENDAFGHSVSIDGDRLAIGADKDDAGNADAASEFGAVYLFDLDRRTGATRLARTLRNGQGVALERHDFFGAHVKLDGNDLIVGAPGDDGPSAAFDERGTGGVYVFRLANSGVALETMYGIHRAHALALSRFDAAGYYVDRSGSTLAIGAPYANGAAGAVYLERQR